MKEEKKRHLKQGSYASVMTVIVIALVIVANLILAQFPSEKTQIDVSTQKLYSITDNTRKLLKDLNQDVTLYYIAQKGNENDTIQKLLRHYEELSNHIKVEQKDPDLYPKFAEQYTSDQVSSNSVIVVSNGKSRVVNESDMYETSINYSTYSEDITGFDGEGQITSAILYVTGENNPRISWVTGHGEAKESDLTSGFSDALKKNNVEIEELSLLTNEIPEDIQCLVIMAPTSDYSKEESQKVVDYLENGGKLLMFTDYSEENFPNLNSILENYGLTRSKGLVVEKEEQHYYPQMPYYLLPNIESDEITSSVSDHYILIPGAQAIEKTDSCRDTVTIKDLLTTSDQAYLEEDPENSTWSEKDDSKKGTFSVGVLVTEELEEEKETKLIYFSGAGMLSQQVDQAVSGSNAKLAAAALASLCEVEDSVLIPSKSTDVTNLVFTQGSVNLWTLITIVILPIAILATGFAVWMKRRKQ